MYFQISFTIRIRCYCLDTESARYRSERRSVGSILSSFIHSLCLIRPPPKSNSLRKPVFFHFLTKFSHMRTSLANFANAALSQSEMKRVTGGTCYVRGAAGPIGMKSGSSAKSFATDWGTNWCCASCGSASWCTGC